MLYTIMNDFVDLSELLWKLFPISKEIIHKFGLSWFYFNRAFTLVVRRDLDNNWVIDVLPNGHVELFEIH